MLSDELSPMTKQIKQQEKGQLIQKRNVGRMEKGESAEKKG